jgi:hypothetical protein
MLLDQYILEADFSFRDAQFWVYVLARALDYKYNTRVLANSPSSSKTYSSTSVFALRNARELLDMARALWHYDTTWSIGNRKGTQFVRFSIREDALGFRKYDNVDQIAYYPDPQTGNLVTAEEAFRSYLHYVASHDAINRYMQDYDDVVHLEFSTTKEKMMFFSRSRWNEKIKWISVRIQADYPNGRNKELMVYLEQSGASFIRNADPDQQGEMTTYPIQYWSLAGSGNWQSKDTFGFGINAVVNEEDTNAPPESYRKVEFHEMPPAVSTWILEIPLRDGSTTYLDLEKVSDIEIWFYNYYHARN